MSIKSEKAKECVSSKRKYYKSIRKFLVDWIEVEKAVELAESDAEQRCRDRAVRAHCFTCRQQGGCPNVDSSIFIGATPECDCTEIQNFLKHYDNE